LILGTAILRDAQALGIAIITPTILAKQLLVPRTTAAVAIDASIAREPLSATNARVELVIVALGIATLLRRALEIFRADPAPVIGRHFAVIS